MTKSSHRRHITRKRQLKKRIKGGASSTFLIPVPDTVSDFSKSNSVDKNRAILRLAYRPSKFKPNSKHHKFAEQLTNSLNRIQQNNDFLTVYSSLLESVDFPWFPPSMYVKVGTLWPTVSEILLDVYKPANFFEGSVDFDLAVELFTDDRFGSVILSYGDKYKKYPIDQAWLDNLDNVFQEIVRKKVLTSEKDVPIQSDSNDVDKTKEEDQECFRNLPTTNCFMHGKLPSQLYEPGVNVRKLLRHYHTDKNMGCSNAAHKVTTYLTNHLETKRNEPVPLEELDQIVLKSACVAAAAAGGRGGGGRGRGRGKRKTTSSKKTQKRRRVRK